MKDIYNNAPVINILINDGTPNTIFIEYNEVDTNKKS